MQQGWQRRRLLEAQVGRAALRAAEPRVWRAPRSFSRCRTRDEQVAYVLALSRRGDDTAFGELTQIIWQSEDEVRFAAREALHMAAAQSARRTQAAVQKELEFSRD